jgi:photosystem II stability/assembly factor-like uncharacterized protein
MGIMRDGVRKGTAGLLVLFAAAVLLLCSAAAASAVDASYHGVDFITAAKGWAVGRNATIVHTVDGGRHWTRQHYVYGGPSLTDVCFRNDGQHGWAVGTAGTVFRTVNGGRTWSLVTGFRVPDPSANLTSVKFVSASTGWVCGGWAASAGGLEVPWGGVWRSTDGGRTWSAPAATYYGWCPTALDASSSRAATCAGILRVVDVSSHRFNVPAVAQTTTGGSSWDPAPTMLDAGTLTASVNDLDQVAAHIVAVGEYDATYPNTPFAFFSADRGSSFSPASIPAGGPGELYGVKMASGTVGYAVGLDARAVLKTTNGGATWRVKPTNYGRELWAVDFVSTTTGYAVGLSVSTGASLVIKTTNGARSWTRVK